MPWHPPDPDAWQRHGEPKRPYQKPEIRGPFRVLTVRHRRPSHHWLRYAVLRHRRRDS